MLDRPAVGQLSSLSSRTEWQRLSAGDVYTTYLTTVSVLPVLLHFLMTNKDNTYVDQNLQLHVINTF